MTDTPDGNHQQPSDEDVPWQQRILDNIWLLLALGVAVPLGFYLLWGLWELAHIPEWGGP